MAVKTDPVERLVLHMTAFNPRAPHTILQYRSVCRKFLSRASIPPGQDDVLRFVAARRAQSTKRFTFAILKRLFEANEWRWPFPAGAAPRLDGREHRPQLDIAAIAALIGGAGRHPSEPWTFYLPLATTYGFRRGELRRITAKSFENGRLTVPTIKGGDTRTHTLPDALRRWLERPPAGELGEAAMTGLFQRMCLQCGVEPPRRAGWHAIRRRLISELSLAVPGVVLSRFMGWKTSPGAGTLYHYARPESEAVDGAVLPHNPWLKAWETIK